MVDKSHTKTLGAPGRSHCDLVSSDEEMLQRIFQERMQDVSMDGSKGQLSLSVLGGTKVLGVKLWSMSHTAIFS